MTRYVYHYCAFKQDDKATTLASFNIHSGLIWLRKPITDSTQEDYTQLLKLINPDEKVTITSLSYIGTTEVDHEEDGKPT